MLKKALLLLFLFLSLCPAAIENVQFTDMEGKEYDLYSILEKGTYVLVHSTFNQ